MLKIFSILLLVISAGSASAKSADAVKYEILLQEQSVIWGFDFLNESELIYTVRSGELKKFNWKNKKVTTLSGGPEVWSRGQGGMLDVRVNPKNKQKIFFSYSKPVGKGFATTALGTAQIPDASGPSPFQLSEVEDVFVAQAVSDETVHFGSRIEFSDQFIFLSVGDRGEREKAQSLKYHNGKIVRLNLKNKPGQGLVPEDNPFVKIPGALPEIWSYGHRNPQGLAKRENSEELWSAEFGPRGGDEINIIKRGANYGWPDVTYGREYYGPKIGVTDKVGMEAPLHYWTPSISPSAVTFYQGKMFKEWKGNLFVATLSGSHLRRLEISEEKNQHKLKISKEEILFKEKGERYRATRVAPDGSLFLSTDSGQIIRVSME